jgi:hypothetical protein
VFESGGKPHVVIANSAAYITLYRFDGVSSGVWNFAKVWERRMNECYPDPGMDAQPVLFDVDRDGKLDILVQTEEVGVFALRLDGSTLWKRCISGGNGEPAVADMDFDGMMDVVFASDDGVVTRLSGLTGATIWSFWAGAKEYNLGVASMPVGPTIGQIDGVGPLDVAVGARDTHDLVDPHKNRAALFALDGKTGRPLWFRQHADGTPLTYTHPIIHDVDKDGKADVLWADWNTVGHKPPFEGDAVQAWALSGTPAVYRYDHAGNLKFRQTIGSYWHNNDLALADVDGDGFQEIIVDDGARGMAYMDSRTGAIKTRVSLGDWVATRGPTVWDLTGGGNMQWIIPVHKGGSGGIMVFDTGVKYNAAWPGIPTGTPASAPPPSSGAFNATFRVPSTTNNWWIEVFVTADRPVTSVVAQVNGGPVALTQSSWGAWTRSVHVPDGAQVVFIARDGTGKEARSSTYTWGSGAPPSFAANFTVPSTTNNWWVETRVSATSPLAKVVAKVDGGPPVELAPTSWGTWAKSFYVPDGAKVVFTATSTGGATATSATYTWGRPTSGEFTATFEVSKNCNEWWVEVAVRASQPVQRVTITVGTQAPVDLSQSSWGAWVKSMYVPRGSQVVFAAYNAAGAKVASEPAPWLGGEPFAATFKATDPSNNWWVEVKVTANRPVRSVDARVDGGPWRPLDATQWGTWAQSFYVADNALVEFRASDGATQVMSPGVRWI